jgi:hypothetical protein
MIRNLVLKTKAVDLHTESKFILLNIREQGGYNCNAELPFFRKMFRILLSICPDTKWLEYPYNNYILCYIATQYNITATTIFYVISQLNTT